MSTTIDACFGAMDGVRDVNDSENNGGPRAEVAPLWGTGEAVGPQTAPPSPAPLPPPPPPPEPPKKGNGLLVVLATGAVAFLAVVAVVVVVAVRGQPPADVGGASAVASPALTTTPSAYRAAEPSLTTGRTTTTTGRTTVTTSVRNDVPAGYRRVTGPARIEVVIPADWPVRPGALASNQQADSPTNPGDVLRFGGSDSVPGSLLDSVAGNETDNSGIRQGYQRLRLERLSTSAVVEVVEWEFLYGADGSRKHAAGRFWRLNGIDYIVYASASAATWPTIKPIFDIAARTAGPTT